MPSYTTTPSTAIAVLTPKLWVSPTADKTAAYFNWFVANAPRAVLDMCFGLDHAFNVMDYRNGSLVANFTGEIPSGAVVEPDEVALSAADSLDVSGILVGLFLAVW